MARPIRVYRKVRHCLTRGVRTIASANELALVRDQNDRTGERDFRSPVEKDVSVFTVQHGGRGVHDPPVKKVNAQTVSDRRLARLLVGGRS